MTAELVETDGHYWIKGTNHLSASRWEIDLWQQLQSEIERRKDAESDLVQANETIAEMRRALEMAGRGVGL